MLFRGVGYGIRLTAVNRGSVNRGTEALYRTCYTEVSVYLIILTEISVNLTAVKRVGYKLEKKIN